MAGYLINPAFYIRAVATDAIDDQATIDAYTSGASTTRQPLYYDNDMEIPLSNTLQSDLIHGPIVAYSDPNISYRLVIKDNTGTTLATTDNMSGISNLGHLEASLDVDTHSIISPTGEDIELDSSGGGHLILDGIAFPSTSGATGQLLQAKDSSHSQWAGNIGFTVSLDSSPQLGGNLDTNGHNIKIKTLYGILDANLNTLVRFNVTSSAVNYIDLTNAATGDAPSITANGSDDNIDFIIDALGDGHVAISGNKLPNSDGEPGQALVSTATGQYAFQTKNALIQNKTYQITTQNLSSGNYILVDDTAPSQTIANHKGALLWSGSFTPRYANSSLKIIVKLTAFAATYPITLSLFNTASDTALAASCVYTDSNHPIGMYLVHDCPSATKTARTYSLRIGNGDIVQGFSVNLNSTGTTSDFGGAMTSYVTIEEYF